MIRHDESSPHINFHHHQPRLIDLIDDLHYTHPECSNEVCWAADRMHLGLASSVKESYNHLLEHRLKADVLCINSSNGTFINDERLSTESAPYELKSGSNVVCIYSTSNLLPFSHFWLGIRLRYRRGRQQDDNPPQTCRSRCLVLAEQNALVAARAAQHQ